MVDVPLGSKYASSATVIVILLHSNVFGNVFLTFLEFSDKILLQFIFSYSSSRHYYRLCQLRTFAGGILVALIQLMLLSEDSFFSF